MQQLLTVILSYFIPFFFYPVLFKRDNFYFSLRQSSFLIELTKKFSIFQFRRAINANVSKKNHGGITLAEDCGRARENSRFSPPSHARNPFDRSFEKYPPSDHPRPRILFKKKKKERFETNPSNYVAKVSFESFSTLNERDKFLLRAPRSWRIPSPESLQRR